MSRGSNEIAAIKMMPVYMPPGITFSLLVIFSVSVVLTIAPSACPYSFGLFFPDFSPYAIFHDDDISYFTTLLALFAGYEVLKIEESQK